MTRLVLVAIVFASALVPWRTSAQQAAADMLPAASAFGRDWTQITALPAVENLDPSFRDAAYGVYGGPKGARIVVEVFLVAPGMTAIRKSWEVGNSDFEFYRTKIDWGYDSSRERDLAAQSLPSGCSDARRTYGVEEIGFQQFPAGITLCAADPDVLVVAFASGEVNGQTGYKASDFAVEAMLNNTAGMPAAN